MPTSTTNPDHSIAACFDQNNQAERFMLGVIDRFHTETNGLRTLAEIRRVVRDDQLDRDMLPSSPSWGASRVGLDRVERGRC